MWSGDATLFSKFWLDKHLRSSVTVVAYSGYAQQRGTVLSCTDGKLVSRNKNILLYIGQMKMKIKN